MDLRISRSMPVGSYHLSSIQAKSLLPNQGAPHSATPELLQLLYAPLIICPRFKPSVSFYTREFRILQLL